MRPADLRRRGFSIDEMRRLARRALPRAVFDCADDAVEDETTLRRNEAALEELRLLPRPLRGAGVRDLSIELLGRRLRLPVIAGPTGPAGLFWPDRELCAARAARGRLDSDGCADQPAGCSLPDVEGGLGAARPVAAGLGEGCSSVPAVAPARRGRVA